MWITFTTLNWVTNHVFIALLGTLNITDPTEKYFLPIVVLGILKLNHLSVRWSKQPTSPLIMWRRHLSIVREVQLLNSKSLNPGSAHDITPRVVKNVFMSVPPATFTLPQIIKNIRISEMCSGTYLWPLTPSSRGLVYTILVWVFLMYFITSFYRAAV